MENERREQSVVRERMKRLKCIIYALFFRCVSLSPCKLWEIVSILESQQPKDSGERRGTLTMSENRVNRNGKYAKCKWCVGGYHAHILSEYH